MRVTHGHFRVSDLLLFVGSLPDVSRTFLESEACAERCRASLADALAHPDPQTRRFAAAGTMDLLQQWLQSDNPEPLDELIGAASTLVDLALSNALDHEAR